jgi:CDP-6-deoxy-D-xylo-4-hexulose-3-dehydrase
MWRLAEDTLGKQDVEALANWLRTEPQLTQGPLVSEFEQRWSAWNGTTDSVMVSSGSTANLALVSAITDETTRPLRIGAAAVTWPTNVTPALMLGHKLTLLDVNPRTLGVDSDVACEAMASGALDVLFVTHLLGFNAFTDEMIRVAGENGVTILEDCCEAHGATFHGEKVGNSGRGATFSFYFGHHMSTVEGGMISSNDLEITDRLRLIRNHGLARSSKRFDEYSARHPDIDRRFLFMTSGMNYRSTEINAFLGLRQLEVIDERIMQRNENLARFLTSAPDWMWTNFRTEGVSSFALPLIAEDSEGYDAIRAVVDRLGIEGRPVVAGNLANQPFLRGTDVTKLPGDLRFANHIHRFGMYVGNGHHVTPEMIEKLCAELRKAR